MRKHEKLMVAALVLNMILTTSTIACVYVMAKEDPIDPPKPTTRAMLMMHRETPAYHNLPTL